MKARLFEFTEHNKNELALYKERIEKYQRAYEIFFRRWERQDAALEKLLNNMDALKASREALMESEKELDGVLEKYTRKKIFLNACEPGGVMGQLRSRIYKKYTDNALKELGELETELETKREEYEKSVEAYNLESGKLLKKLERLREGKVLEKYDSALRYLYKYTKEAVKEDFLPDFKGEFSVLYAKPVFSEDPNENMKYFVEDAREDGIEPEALKIENFERLLDKMERADKLN